MLYTGGFTLSQSPTAKPPCYILFVELSVCQNCSAQNKPPDMASLVSHGSNASIYHETEYHLTGSIFCLYLDSQDLLSSLTSIFSFSAILTGIYALSTGIMTHDARKPTIQPLYILCRVFKFTDVPEIDYVSYQFRHLANPDARQLVILE